MILKELGFQQLDDNGGYQTWYYIPAGPIRVGNEKTHMVVVKDDKIVFEADKELDQFHQRVSCEEYIERALNSD